MARGLAAVAALLGVLVAGTDARSAASRASGVCATTPGRTAKSFAPYGSAPALGRGPVYPVMTELRGGAVHYASGRRPDGWAGFKVLWIVRPSYAGPIVIRGRRLDRRGPLRFSIAVEPNPDVERIVRELRRPAAAGWNEGWRDYPSTVLVRRAGCYAFRIEGASFTRTIVFRARP